MYQRGPYISQLPFLLSDRLPEGTDDVPIFTPAKLSWVRPSGQATLLLRRQVVTVTQRSSLTSHGRCPASASAWNAYWYLLLTCVPTNV